MKGDRCPTCNERPPRRPWSGFGRVSYCQPCWLAVRKSHEGATVKRRKAERAADRASRPAPMCSRCNVNPPRYFEGRPGKVPLCGECHHSRWSRKYRKALQNTSDLTAAQIDRAFDVALREIRRQKAIEATA